jgi:hypothetical protein
MSKNITHYYLLISCPSDVSDEISIIEDAVADFNKRSTKHLDISIDTINWSKDAYAASGDTPQNILNKQFVKECDAAIAIFWTRFGQPTDEYGSGTEEEIKIMLDAGKQVLMYFCEKPMTPEQALQYPEEYQRIQAFRDWYKDKGLYFPYSDNDEFRNMLDAHLARHFISLKKIEEITLRSPELKLMTAVNGNVSNSLEEGLFITRDFLNISTLQTDIENSYVAIKEMKFSEVPKLIKNAVMYAPVLGERSKSLAVDENYKIIISKYAESRSIELPDDFFNLGGLSKISTVMPGHNRINGTTKEIEKYNAIHHLAELLKEYMNRSVFTNAFDGLSCIRVLLANNGTAVDEDIDISLYFDTQMLLTPSKLPRPDETDMKSILDDLNMNELFNIKGTANYDDYDSTCQKFVSSPPSRKAISNLFRGRDIEKEYDETIESMFNCYSIIEEGDSIIVKIRMEYLKHNTIAAFPTVLFVDNRISTIPYKITSKHLPAVIEETLSVAHIKDEAVRQ